MVSESVELWEDYPEVLCFWNTGPGVFGREARKLLRYLSRRNKRAKNGGRTETGRSFVLVVSFYSSFSSFRSLYFPFSPSLSLTATQLKKINILRHQPI